MSAQTLCQNQVCQKSFKIIPQEKEFYKARGIPDPVFCPACRHKERMALRSERALYSRACGKCQKKTLSTLPESAPYTVYCQDCFWANIG